ncbi:Asp23/Gls24 family envelope stress response protein [Thermincola potens]|nr:Asp23/Gls24 family envelope stress response protein [Thermincola potens]
MGDKEKLGNVNISEEVIATIAGAAAVECYGIVGMAARKLKDGIAQLLGREDLTKGVQVKLEGSQVTVDLYIIVSYGVNIAEVAKNVMERVKYSLSKYTDLETRAINVNVQGVRVSNGG